MSCWEKSPGIVFGMSNQGDGGAGPGCDPARRPSDPWRSLPAVFQTSCLSPPRFGRHPVLILSLLFMLVFGLSVAFSANVTVFSTLRFFEGFCLAGLALCLYVLREYPRPDATYPRSVILSGVFTLKALVELPVLVRLGRISLVTLGQRG